MTRFRLADHADLTVFYEADTSSILGNREDVLRIVTRDVFIAHYRTCPSIGFVCDGHAIGGLIYDRGHAHLAVLPAFHGQWAILWKPALEWLFDMAPEAMAVVDADNSVCIEFMRRNGWPALSVDNGRISYLMTPRPGALSTRRCGIGSAR